MVKLIMYQCFKCGVGMGGLNSISFKAYIKLLSFLISLPSQLNLLILAMTDYPCTRVKLTLTLKGVKVLISSVEVN